MGKLPEPWDLINLRNTKTQLITCSRRVETYWRSGSWRSRKWSRRNWSATCSPWSCWRIEAGTLSGYALYYKAMRSATVTARLTLEMGSMHSLNSTINWLGLNFWFNELQAGVNYPRDKFDQSLIIERLGDIFPYFFHIFSFRSFDTSRFNGQTKSLPLWSPAEPIASTHSHHFQSQVSLLCHYYVITMSLLCHYYVITSRFRRWHTSFLYTRAESDGTFPKFLMSFSWTNWVSKIAYLYNSKHVHHLWIFCRPRSGKLQQDKLRSKGKNYICFIACCCHPLRADMQPPCRRLSQLESRWDWDIWLMRPYYRYNFRDFLKRWACFALRNHEEHSDLIFEFHHFPTSTTLKHGDIVDIAIKQEEMHLSCLICER